MKKGKYAKGGAGAKALILVLTVALLVGVSVGGTLAWLTAKSEVVTNTFTESDIEITLTETEREYKMIPGWTIEKDPNVTVLANSEDCYLFVKVEEACGLDGYTFDDFIDYDIDPNNWTELKKDAEGKDLNGIYYCKATDITADRRIKVLGYTDAESEFHPQQVLVKDTVTKEMMDLIDGVDADGKTDTDAAKAELGARPTLTFTAYAVQLYKSNNDEFTVDEAWAKAAAMSTQS